MVKKTKFGMNMNDLIHLLEKSDRVLEHHSVTNIFFIEVKGNIIIDVETEFNQKIDENSSVYDLFELIKILDENNILDQNAFIDFQREIFYVAKYFMKSPHEKKLFQFADSSTRIKALKIKDFDFRKITRDLHQRLYLETIFDDIKELTGFDIYHQSKK